VTKQLLFYERARPLSQKAHGDARVATDRNFAFSAEANAAPIVTAEFTAVAREYPIIFMKAGAAFAPAVLLGLRERENLMVDADGRWAARYAPAFIRRYPFVISHVPGNEDFVVCIDEVALVADGVRLFDEDGAQTEFLKKQLEFLSDYQRQTIVTLRFCERLEKLDLLTPMTAKFVAPSGEEAVTGGFYAVARDRLAQVGDDQAAELFRSGWMELIHLHLHSLGAVDLLQQRLRARDAGVERLMH